MIADILKKIKKIEMRAQGPVHGLLQGAYLSVFKGTGIEFSEVREYAIGDDIRSIDWNVTARIGKPFIKEFIQERDLSLYFLLDVSGSNRFGAEQQKRERAIEVMASLMFAALRNNDNIGMALFTDSLEQFSFAKKGKRQIMHLLTQALMYEPHSKKTHLAPVLDTIGNILRRKSTICILSDFQSPDYEVALRRLAQRHHVIALHLEDAHEATLPDVGFIRLEDEETGEQILIDTSDKEFRKRFEELQEQKREQNVAQFAGIQHTTLISQEDYALPLRKLLAGRR